MTSKFDSPFGITFQPIYKPIEKGYNSIMAPVYATYRSSDEGNEKREKLAKIRSALMILGTIMSFFLGTYWAFAEEELLFKFVGVLMAFFSIILFTFVNLIGVTKTR